LEGPSLRGTLGPACEPSRRPFQALRLLSALLGCAEDGTSRATHQRRAGTGHELRFRNGLCLSLNSFDRGLPSNSQIWVSEQFSIPSAMSVDRPFWHPPWSSSEGLRGVVRNLPTGVTSPTRHPVVALAQAGRDLQEDPEHGGIGRGGELTLRQMAAGLRIERVEPRTPVGGRLVDILGPALADGLPVSASKMSRLGRRRIKPDHTSPSKGGARGRLELPRPLGHRILRLLALRTDPASTSHFVSSGVVQCPRMSSCREQGVSKSALRRRPGVLAARGERTDQRTTARVPQSASSESPVFVICTRSEPSALTMAMSDRFPASVARVKTIFVPSGDHPG
jgi:hypothetical protein